MVFETVIVEILAVSVVPLHCAAMLDDHEMVTLVTAGVNTTVLPGVDGSVGSAHAGGTAWKSTQVRGRSTHHGLVAGGSSAATTARPRKRASTTAAVGTSRGTLMDVMDRNRTRSRVNLS
jgi:hypothetical protein